MSKSDLSKLSTTELLKLYARRMDTPLVPSIFAKPSWPSETVSMLHSQPTTLPWQEWQAKDRTVAKPTCPTCGGRGVIQRAELPLRFEVLAHDWDRPIEPLKIVEVKCHTCTPKPRASLPRPLFAARYWSEYQDFLSPAVRRALVDARNWFNACLVLTVLQNEIRTESELIAEVQSVPVDKPGEIDAVNGIERRWIRELAEKRNTQELRAAARLLRQKPDWLDYLFEYVRGSSVWRRYD